MLNFIDCKLKKAMQAYMFALSMFFKSLIDSNIDVFEDLNILQIKINKTNLK